MLNFVPALIPFAGSTLHGTSRRMRRNNRMRILIPPASRAGSLAKGNSQCRRGERKPFSLTMILISGGNFLGQVASVFKAGLGNDRIATRKHDDLWARTLVGRRHIAYRDLRTAIEGNAARSVERLAESEVIEPLRAPARPLAVATLRNRGPSGRATQSDVPIQRSGHAPARRSGPRASRSRAGAQ